MTIQSLPNYQYGKMVSKAKHILLFVMMLYINDVDGQSLRASRLTCEYKVNPLGIDKHKPKLGWQLQSGDTGILQTAYRVLVADDSLLLTKNVGNIWDSKKQIAATSIQVSYKGTPLKAAKKYFWKVMVWNNRINSSAWSETASFQMGLLTTADWKQAKWIAFARLPDSLKIERGIPDRGPKGLPPLPDTMPLLRKQFETNKPVKNATIFICGLGQFELSINGKKIGDHFLDPAWTKFDEEAMYVSFDVTGDIVKGNNAIGVMLGNGFHLTPRTRYRKLTNAIGYPKVIARLVIEYLDGSSRDIITDQSWKVARSPITYSSIFGGEDFDARLEEKGWNTASFDDRHWKPALLVEGTPQLRSQLLDPIRFFETFLPKKISALGDSSFVADLGQNASGIPEITVQGKRGDTIKIIPGELLNNNGTVNQRATGNPFYFQYVLNSSEPETWQPRFTYYGYRYLQVQGATVINAKATAGLPIVMEIKSLHMHNAAREVGNFNSSSELFNKTNDLINWAVKSNMQSVITDCPHREKLGWLEQVHLMGSSIRYNYEVVNLMKKTVYDMMVSQTSDGLIPEIAPEYVEFNWGGDMFRDSPEWGSCGIILPWYLYQWYGERDMLQVAYPMMKRYINYLGKKARGHILTQGLGDWYDLGPKDPGVSQLTRRGLTATAIYYYDLQVLSNIAGIIGQQADAAAYTNLGVKVKQAFNDTFFNPLTNQYATGSQTSNAMALYMNLVPQASRNAVISNLVSGLQANNNALTAGDIGYRYLLRVLEAEGKSEVIYAMNNRSDVPGYGYQLAKGATALTESWQALPTVSNNHLMLGHIMEWFYSGLAGIRQDETAVAFKKIIIHPDPVGDINAARASHDSPYGLIVSDWRKETGKFTLQVNIPANTTATIYLPATSNAQIRLNQKTISREYRRFEKGRFILQLGSGSYLLEAINN